MSLADTQCVEKHGGCAKVHAVGADEEAVRSDTRQLVHHNTDNLCAARYFNACSTFKEQTQAVVVVVGREIVESVHVVERLGVCERLAKFFHTAVDVTHVHVDFLDFLAVDGSAETKNAVCGGVLRANVHHKILGAEYFNFFLHHLAVLFHPGVGEVGLTLVFNRHGVEGGVFIVVLAQGEALPVDVEEEATHVGVANENNAVEVVNLTFVEACHTPKVGYGVEHWALAVGCTYAYAYYFVGLRRHQIVNAPERFLPVHTYNGNEVVHGAVVAESSSEGMPFGVVDSDGQGVGLLYCSFGVELCDLFLYICHIICFCLKLYMVIGQALSR